MSVTSSRTFANMMEVQYYCIVTLHFKPRSKILLTIPKLNLLLFTRTVVHSLKYIAHFVFST